MPLDRIYQLETVQSTVHPASEQIYLQGKVGYSTATGSKLWFYNLNYCLQQAIITKLFAFAFSAYQWSPFYFSSREKVDFENHTLKLGSLQRRSPSSEIWFYICKNDDFSDVFLLITDIDKNQNWFCLKVRNYASQRNFQRNFHVSTWQLEGRKKFALCNHCC